MLSHLSSLSLWDCYLWSMSTCRLTPCFLAEVLGSYQAGNALRVIFLVTPGSWKWCFGEVCAHVQCMIMSLQIHFPRRSVFWWYLWTCSLWSKEFILLILSIPQYPSQCLHCVMFHCIWPCELKVLGIFSPERRGLMGGLWSQSWILCQERWACHSPLRAIRMECVSFDS